MGAGFSSTVKDGVVTGSNSSAKRSSSSLDCANSSIFCRKLVLRLKRKRGAAVLVENSGQQLG